jgi:hypothetical protein
LKNRAVPGCDNASFATQSWHFEVGIKMRSQEGEALEGGEFKEF